ATQTITVAINNDGTFEGAERFNINLSNPVGAVIVDGQGVGTIVDDGRTLPGGPANDDSPFVTSVSSPSVQEGNNLVFEIQLSNPSLTTTTVALALQGITATEGLDWSSVGSVSFNNGASWSALTANISVPALVTSFMVRLPTADDAIDETAETMSLSASTSRNGVPVQGVGTILDNDPFTDANETVSVNEDTILNGSVLTGTSSGEGPVSVTTFTVGGTTYAAGATATLAGV
ncbi:Calx-beta domain-containing protein, partial [Dechloromonas hortensis]|uniref:Calx-beta domain-containing protein n=1 Tax=Dechloromonas hortensis TaxID=337779 RepID=UPI001B882E67